MIDIANVEFHFETARIGDRLVQRHATTLFDDWERYVLRTLSVSDYSLHLELIEGSIKGRATIAAKLKRVALSVAAYGSVAAGIREIATEARDTGGFLVREAHEFFAHSATAPARTKHNAGRLQSLERIFQRVGRGELTNDEAAHLAEALLEDQKSEASEFIAEVVKALRNTRRPAKQLTLDLPPDLDSPYRDDPSDGGTRRPARKPPLVPLVPPSRYRVEIWRESKKGKKQMTIEPL